MAIGSKAYHTHHPSASRAVPDAKRPYIYCLFAPFARVHNAIMRAWRSAPVTMRVTAWIAVLTLFVHAVVMATHVPPALTAALSQATQVAVADEHCHHHAMAEAPAVDSGHAEHGSPSPAGMPGHFTYCPICLSLHGGKILGPSAAPVLALPVVAVVAQPLPPDEAVHHERPARPFSARAPPVVV